jgi:hypothetical protein
MNLFDGNGNIFDISNGDINCKIIAHRGYHATAKQNTIAAFVDAAENGFKWLEVDIRKRTDNIYVMAHDATSTLYDNGTAKSLTIASNAYADIKNYTWDTAGKYKLCTLQAVFNMAKAYDLHIICDLKNGSNKDVMGIAALCGATDRVLLSYASFAAAYNEAWLLSKYDNVPIRCVPSDYSNFNQLAAEISNPIYADVNASTKAHYQSYLNIALSCGIPILFSGCTLSNKNIWQVIASGCMANADLNISHGDFYSAIANDFDAVNEISLSNTELTLAVNGTAELTAESALQTVAGFVYAYSEDPTTVTIAQTAFGSKATATATGIQAGSTNIVFFSGNGEVQKVAVTVS